MANRSNATSPPVDADVDDRAFARGDHPGQYGLGAPEKRH